MRVSTVFITVGLFTVVGCCMPQPMLFLIPVWTFALTLFAVESFRRW